MAVHQSDDDGGGDDKRSAVMRLLKDEYFFVQGQVHEYSKTCFQMKYWAITTTVGGLALAAGSSLSPRPIAALLIAANVLFWMAEALWRSYQFAFQWVANRQENDFMERANDYQGPRMRDDLHRYFKRRGASLAWVGVLLQPRTSLPYLLVILAGLILFALPDLAVSWINTASGN